MVFDMVTRSASDSRGPVGWILHAWSSTHWYGRQHIHQESIMPEYVMVLHYPPPLDEALQTCRGSRSPAWHAMQVQLKIAIQWWNCLAIYRLQANNGIYSKSMISHIVYIFVRNWKKIQRCFFYFNLCYCALLCTCVCLAWAVAA